MSYHPGTSPAGLPPSPSGQQVMARLPLSKPRLTYILLAINIAIWLAMTVTGLLQGLGLSGSESTTILLQFGAQKNSLVAQGEYWRLLTSMFLHIGVMHLLFNSYALYILGRDVESLYGSGRFLAIYFLSGLGGSVAFYLLGHFLGDDVPSAGASGAIFGLIGTEVAYFWVHRDKFGQRGQQRLLNLLIVIGFNLFIGFSVPGINNIAHIGGLVTGTMLGWLLVPQYSFPSPPIGQEALVLQDRNSLRRRLPAVGAVLLVLLLMVFAGTSLWKSSPTLALERAILLLDSEDYQGAAAILRPLAADQQEDGIVHFYLGVAEANLGNLEGARAAWEQSAEMEPDIPSTRWNLALVYEDLGRTEDAIAELEVYLQLSDSAPQQTAAEKLLEELRQ